MRRGLYYIQNTMKYSGDYLTWLKPGEKEYTPNICEAGLFTEEQIKRICKNTRQYMAWPYTYIKKNMQLVVNAICLEKHRAKWRA